MQRYFIHLAYHGQAYSGWQLQPNANTVQAEVNKALSVLLRTQVMVHGCGRTDAGVHASSFFAHFNIEADVDIVWLIEKVNHVLPNDIAVFDIFPVDDDKHARFGANRRTYHYHMHTQNDPFLYDRSLKINYKLDISGMNEVAAKLLEVRDFASFCKAGGTHKTTHCKLSECYWEQSVHRIRFTVSADRFLRNMVRSMVGTFVELGRGKITANDFMEIVDAKDRTRAGTSALAHGLFLVDVRYPFL